MPDQAVFVDTSIPIYAAGRQSEHKEACSRVLGKIERDELEAATDAEVIQEVLYRFHRLNMATQGLQLSRNVLRLGLRVLPVLKRDVERALPLFEKYSPRGVPPRDALHTALMINNNIAKIISVDKHFGDVIKEVERVDPESML